MLSTLLLLALPGDPAALHPVEGDSLWDRLEFYANGRLRAESTLDQPNGEDRHRGRARIRAGAKYRITDDLVFETRLTSVSDGSDANNPHWDFGDGPDGFSSAAVGLDRFFLEWKPGSSVRLLGGKMPHAFARPPVFGELAWDDDVHPAGLAAVWSFDGEGKLRGDVRVAEYVAVENGGDQDPAMFGLQGNLYYRASDTTSFQVSSSISDWSHLDAGAGVPGNQGNTDPMGDFSIWDSFASATFQGGPMGSTSAFFQLMKNVDDDTDEDTGQALGVQLGTTGKKGAKSLFAVAYDLDANAIFSAVAQDDTPIAGTGVGTGMEGLILGGQYFINDNLSLKLWCLTSDADAADDPVRFRFDIDFRVK